MKELKSTVEPEGNLHLGRGGGAEPEVDMWEWLKFFYKFQALFPPPPPPPCPSPGHYRPRIFQGWGR